MSRTLLQLIALGSGLWICAAAAGCSRQGGAAPPGGPPPVTISEPIRRDVTDYAEYPGRTAAVDMVQVRARVSGYLQKINFQDGSEVKEGAVLYEIDPRPYQDALKQAVAQVALQDAQVKYNQATYERDQALYAKSDAVALATVQQDWAQLLVSKASLDAAKAGTAQARLNLDWTKVAAPIDGRLSRTFLTRGNLVTADSTVLTTITSEDPMYAYFDVDELTVLRVRQLIREGKFPGAPSPGSWPVSLCLANEEGYPHQGTVDFSNNQYTPGTATLQVRGLFPNPKPKVGERVLTPGQFVRVRVPVSPPHPALLVSQDAIATNQNVKYVYVVNAEDKVEVRDVTLGEEHDGLQEIAKGLRPEDHVIVNGLQHVKAGAEVKPKLVPMPVPKPGEVSQTPPAVMPLPKPEKTK